MNIILFFGVFWTLYGILGILGIQRIHNKYKNKPWTKQYKKSVGISWIILGVPWIILGLIVKNIDLSIGIKYGLIILIGIPSIIYSIKIDKKYNAVLQNEK